MGLTDKDARLRQHGCIRLQTRWPDCSGIGVAGRQVWL